MAALAIVIGSALAQVVLAACVGALTVYGFHRALLVYASRPRRARRFAAARATQQPAREMTVTVQLPMFNEERVCRRVIDAACRLRWPRDLLEVQVLDDSTDATPRIVDDAVAVWRARGVDVKVMRRPTRDGYKGGALALGTARARGELLAVFDADFVPPPDFLERTAPLFSSPDVGLVQARWSHLNEDHSLLTRVEAAFLDAHFVVEQAGRAASGRWFNFNGTAGVWRRTCVDDAGGWQGDTLSEDVDLSYRAQLRGWRFVYLDDVTVPAELPPSIVAFKTQQRRWMTGLAQAAKKLLVDVWRADAPVAHRVEATLHLASPLASAATTMLGVALPLVAVWSPSSTSSAALVLYAGTLGAAAFFVTAQRRLGRPLHRAVLLLPLQMALGIGIAPSNVLGCVRSLFQRAIPFERTPKTGAVSASTTRQHAARFATSSAPTARVIGQLLPELIIELALAAHATAALVLIVAARQPTAGTVFIVLFAVGYGWVGIATLCEAVRTSRAAWLASTPLRQRRSTS